MEPLDAPDPFEFPLPWGGPKSGGTQAGAGSGWLGGVTGGGGTLSPEFDELEEDGCACGDSGTRTCRFQVDLGVIAGMLWAPITPLAASWSFTAWSTYGTIAAPSRFRLVDCDCVLATLALLWECIVRLDEPAAGAAVDRFAKRKCRSRFCAETMLVAWLSAVFTADTS